MPKDCGHNGTGPAVGLRAPARAERLSINGNHTLRDGPKTLRHGAPRLLRRDLLRVSGNYLWKTTMEPLVLRSRLLRSEASRRVLAASRRAPAGENRQSPSGEGRGEGPATRTTRVDSARPLNAPPRTRHSSRSRPAKNRGQFGRSLTIGCKILQELHGAFSGLNVSHPSKRNYGESHL